jgi:hypothetical protein
MSDIYAELHCEKCPTVMLVDTYSEVADQVGAEIYGKSGPKSKKEAFSKLESLFLRLAELIGQCHCGGTFSYHAPYRCPVCGNGITLEEIKQQINWWGSPDGRPGVVMTDFMDQKGRRELPTD